MTTPGNGSLDGDGIPVVAKMGCSGWHCPTLFDATTDQYLVQGNVVAAEIAVRLACRRTRPQAEVPILLAHHGSQPAPPHQGHAAARSSCEP